MDCSVCVVASLRLGLADYIIRVVVVFCSRTRKEKMRWGEEMNSRFLIQFKIIVEKFINYLT